MSSRRSGEDHGRAAAANEPAASNFLRAIVEDDLRSGRYAGRTWSGKPGPAAAQSGAPPDPCPVRTRFPPEPNGYLHLGHSKAICLNFGLARDYGGTCHLRFDDTNPTKEEQEYVDSILDAVHWLGFDWGEHLYFASDYFQTLYEFAEAFIERGYAYVDSQSAEEMRANRGTLTEPGRDSPYRDRTPQENLALFRRMAACEFPDGAYYVMTDISDFGFRDDVEFTKHLIREIGVAVVPGSSFYHDKTLGSQKVRFCFCKKDETLEAAAERLQELKKG